MPRKPYPVKRARALLEEWVALRVPQAPEEASITAADAISYLHSRGIPTARSTLYSQGLNELVAEGARKQAREGGGRKRDEEWAAYEAKLAELRELNRALDTRKRELLGIIATMTFNARRFNISEAELQAPIPVPDRSGSRAGRRARRRS